MKRKYDFCGWATKYNVKCSDGRTIMHKAFADQDGKQVPLVWQHQHNSPENVLGKVVLESRKDGMYAYGSFNDTYMGQQAKQIMAHGDVNQLSIFANKLTQKNNGEVYHGNIREVSLVLAGANPEAIVENLTLEHSEDGEVMEMIIFPEEPIELYHGDADEDPEENEQDDNQVNNEETKGAKDVDERTIEEVIHGMTEDQQNVLYYLVDEASSLEHADFDMEDGRSIEDVVNEMTEEQQNVLFYLVGEASEMQHDGMEEDSFEEDEDLMHADNRTIGDVLDGMTDEEKNVVYYLIAQALEEANVKHSDMEDEEMKYNVFDNNEAMEDVLSQDAMEEIFEDAKRNGSLRKSFLAHADEYGITDIEYLFPDYKTLQDAPEFIKRNDEWVDVVMDGVRHTPFSRIKSVFADITADDARAKGYTKGNLKLEEVFTLLRRTTDPQTIYKKQKLDRDDILDITDFNVVAWLKTEMRIQLDEEIARAILVGDNRDSLSADKISAEHIRPIWQDSELYTINTVCEFTQAMTDTEKCDLFITKAIKARKNYKGSGNPIMFITEDRLADLLLMKDGIGHRMYKTEAELASALRVSKIVPCTVMEGLTRTGADTKTYTLEAVIVNLKDYNVGADKGGSISMFEDFDIDYNQEKYLIETRCSGALIKPYAAITVESTTSVG